MSTTPTTTTTGISNRNAIDAVQGKYGMVAARQTPARTTMMVDEDKTDYEYAETDFFEDASSRVPGQDNSNEEKETVLSAQNNDNGNKYDGDEEKGGDKSKNNDNDESKNDDGDNSDKNKDYKTSSQQELPYYSASLLEEMMEGLALSMLMFLIADLRLMSATGRIATKYETIAIDSDYIVRDSAAIMSGLEKPTFRSNNTNTTTITSSEQSRLGKKEALSSQDKQQKLMENGLTPAQMMAIVLIELKKSFDEQDNGLSPVLVGGVDGGGILSYFAMISSRNKENANENANTKHQRSNETPQEKSMHDNMHGLLRAYVNMIGSDLVAKVPHIEMRRSMLNLMSSSRDYLSPVAEGEAAAGGQSGEMTPAEEEKSLREFQMRLKSSAQTKRSQGKDLTNSSDATQARKFASVAMPEQESCAGPISAAVLTARATKAAAIAQLRISQMKKNMILDERQRINNEMKETTDALFHMGEGDPKVRQSIVQCNSGPNSNNNHSDSLKTSVGSGGDKRTLSSRELLTLMEKAVESRDYVKIEFMANFFRHGTLSHCMAKSKARIVWVNDWYPQKELTYAIALDAEKKRVLVIFRGAITSQDWSKATAFSLAKHPNPITEDYEDKSPVIDLHRGFSQYMLRVRKDTGTTKYDEIASHAHRFGLERIGADYHLAVQGHSLGAAMTTLFGFLASVDPRFTKNGPVKMFTFGSPYVGGHLFADAFRHQEKTGKVCYARFYNHNDSIAYCPVHMGITKRGSKYRHVGLDIKIPPVPSALTHWKPNVSYIEKESFFKTLLRSTGRSVFFHLALPWRIAKMHTLAELLQRVMDGMSTPYYEETDFMLLEFPIEDVYSEVAGIDIRNILRYKMTGGG